MSIANAKELKEAEARFWALASQAPPPSKLPANMEAFRNAQSATTLAHIARQEQLRAQGNAPVAAPPAASAPASNPVADAFFNDAQAPGTVNVKRYNT